MEMLVLERKVRNNNNLMVRNGFPAQSLTGIPCIVEKCPNGTYLSTSFPSRISSFHQRHNNSKAVRTRTHTVSSTSSIFSSITWFFFVTNILYSSCWFLGESAKPVREDSVRRRRAMGACKEEGICFPCRAMMTLLEGQADRLTG